MSNGFVRKRVIAALTVVAVGSMYLADSWKTEATQHLQDRTMSVLLSNISSENRLDEVYQDADGDLVANTPENEALRTPPTELVFSFIASEDPANQSEVWQTVVDAIGAKLDLQVKYLKLDETKQQLEALRSGKLHITALSTCTVPVAVNSAGFVPVCTFGHGDGDFGYQMNFIVRADGNIQKLENLRGKKSPLHDLYPIPAAKRRSSC